MTFIYPETNDWKNPAIWYIPYIECQQFICKKHADV